MRFERKLGNERSVSRYGVVRESRNGHHARGSFVLSKGIWLGRSNSKCDFEWFVIWMPVILSALILYANEFKEFGDCCPKECYCSVLDCLESCWSFFDVDSYSFIYRFPKTHFFTSSWNPWVVIARVIKWPRTRGLQSWKNGTRHSACSTKSQQVNCWTDLASLFPWQSKIVEGWV